MQLINISVINIYLSLSIFGYCRLYKLNEYPICNIELEHTVYLLAVHNSQEFCMCRKAGNSNKSRADGSRGERKTPRPWMPSDKLFNHTRSRNFLTTIPYGCFLRRGPFHVEKRILKSKKLYRNTRSNLPASNNYKILMKRN